MKDKELKRKRNINETNDKKTIANNKTNSKNKKDMSDDDAVVVSDSKFETISTAKKSDSNISKFNDTKDKRETIKITEEVIVDEVKSRNKNSSKDKNGISNSNTNEP